jgi:hypothetical protein
MIEGANKAIIGSLFISGVLLVGMFVIRIDPDKAILEDQHQEAIAPMIEVEAKAYVTPETWKVYISQDIAGFGYEKGDFIWIQMPYRAWYDNNPEVKGFYIAEIFEGNRQITLPFETKDECLNFGKQGCKIILK